MTEHATARHRARNRASTPLSALGNTLTTAVTGNIGIVGRGGIVLAMSSGLVASMGMPSDAATKTSLDTGAVPLAAPTVEKSFLTLPAAFVSGAPVTAPATATVQFEHDTFTVVPKSTTATAVKSRVAERPSRSLQRAPGKVTPAPKTTVKRPRPVGGVFGSAKGSSVIAVAARYVGVYYRYGGTTPAGFDCSGYVKYVFGQLGVKIPRTARQQYAAAHHITRAQARPGDVVFFLGSGGVFHVAIYAGGNMIYDSPHTGKAISKRAIWSSSIAFGRF